DLRTFRQQSLDRKRNPLHGHIDADDLNFDDLSDMDGLARILNETIRKFGHVYQTILVHSDVDEGSKVGDVRYSTFQNHVDFQVRNLFDILTEGRNNKLVTRVTTGFQQLLLDIIQRE